MDIIELFNTCNLEIATYEKLTKCEPLNCENKDLNFILDSCIMIYLMSELNSLFVSSALSNIAWA